MGTYFHTETTRLSFRELWRLTSRWPVFLRACVNKICGIRTPVRWAVCHEQTIRTLQPDEVPDAVLRALGPLVEEFQQLGAGFAFYQTVPAAGNLEGYSAVLVAPEHNAVILIVWARAQIFGPRKATVGCAVTSRLQDGTFF